MDELDKNIPDDFWRRTFDEAAETPPPRVWNAIERRLDEDDGAKVVPLWGMGLLASKPFAWGVGIAATVALLLVGWWLFSNQPATNPVAQKQIEQPGQPERMAKTGNKSKTNIMPNSEAPTVASVEKQPAGLSQKPVHYDSPAAIHSQQKPVKEVLSQKLPDESPKLAVSPMRKTVTSTLELYDRQRLDRQPPSGERMIVFGTTLVSRSIPDETDQSQPLVVETLLGKPLRLRSPGPIQRIVWFGPSEPSTEPDMIKSKREPREKWASVSMMPGAFDPLVSVRSAQTAGFSNAASNLSGSANQQSVRSQPNFSVAWQASAGVELSDRWSIESGIGYLAGRSTVESPAQAGGALSSFNPANQPPTPGNLYADAVRNSSYSALTSNASKGNNDMLAGTAAANDPRNYQVQRSYDSRNQQVLTNNYQYLQLPVQVGYQLRPRKRLSMAVLGGFLTNIFVRNTVGSDLVVTTKDGIYRPVSLSATVGARLRYRPSRRWSASLAGVYQPSLGFGTKPASQVQSRPTSAGMSFGVDYHF